MVASLTRQATRRHVNNRGGSRKKKAIASRIQVANRDEISQRGKIRFRHILPLTRVQRRVDGQSVSLDLCIYLCITTPLSPYNPDEQLDQGYPDHTQATCLLYGKIGQCLPSSRTVHFPHLSTNVPRSCCTACLHIMKSTLEWSNI